MEQYLKAWKKYAVFSGRANRDEYWYFLIGNLIIAFVLGFIEAGLGIAPETEESIFAGIFNILTIVPSIAVGVRRVHDLGKNGWFSIIPLYNLYLFCKKGTLGPNKYGPTSL